VFIVMGALAFVCALIILIGAVTKHPVAGAAVLTFLIIVGVNAPHIIGGTS
jgi:hypothetical protein